MKSPVEFEATRSAVDGLCNNASATECPAKWPKGHFALTKFLSRDVVSNLDLNPGPPVADDEHPTRILPKKIPKNRTMLFFIDKFPRTLKLFAVYYHAYLIYHRFFIQNTIQI
jgi:hypothetical protein